MDIVEISRKVLDVATNYFDFQKTDNMNIFIQDGYDFILNSTKKYDMIFFDVFDENYIPKELLNDDFILSLKNILQKDGLLIFNTFTSSKTYKTEEEMIKSKFAYNKQIAINNRIIFSSDNLLEESKISKNFANKIKYKKYCNKLENI
jgi:spermidine synthase